VRKGKKRAQWAQVESAGRKSCSSFSDAFKTYVTPREGRPRRFTPNNEQVGRDMGGTQPDEGGLPIKATYMSPKLFLLLACIKSTIYECMQIPE
jgi:hypothetical protein